MAITEVHFFAEGRVQGVGYREFARRAAMRHGVSGWARNRADGTVEVLARGAPEAVEALLDDLRRGPPGAAVAGLRVASRELAGVEGEQSFRILPTVG